MFGRHAENKPKLCFEYDRAKAAQVVLWFLSKHGGTLEKLKLVKLVFFADMEHVTRYGRPLFGGHYVTMKDGPVSSPLLDDINSSITEGKGPFYLADRDGFIVRATELPDESFFSESDINALTETNNTYGHKDKWGLVALTHEFKAWIDNQPDGEDGKKRGVLPYEDFFKDSCPNPKVLEIMQEDQEVRDLLNEW